MTGHGHVWFDYLTTAYVQSGSFGVTETRLPGRHSMPRTEQITPAGSVPVTFPETFQREWATLVTGTDARDVGADPGAYGIGVPVHERTITIPRVSPVHLLYQYTLSGTKEERILVQAPASAAGMTTPATDLATRLGMVGPDLSRLVKTFEEYVKAFPVEGFNRFGFLLPRGVSRSKASELHSHSGVWTDVSGVPVIDGVVYFEPMFINNQRPLFDLIYLQSDVTDLDSNVMNVPSRLLRWRGGIRSEATAPINRAGGPVMRDGFFYDTARGVMTEPRLETIVVDGVNFSNADAYGMGFRRQ